MSGERGLMAWLKRTWPDCLNVTVGLWMIASAFVPVFAGSPAGAWTAGLTGLAITIVSVAAVMGVRPWKEASNLVLGLGLLVAPWPLGFALWSHPFWNFAGDGLFLAGHAAYQLYNPPQQRDGA